MVALDSIETHPTPGRIEIESDGTHYTGPLGGHARLDAVVDLTLMSGMFGGRIKNWSVEIRARSSALDYPLLLRPERSESYPRLHRPKDVIRTLPMSFDFSGHGTNLCNAMAGEMRALGFSNAEIFGSDRPPEVEVEPFVEVERTVALGFVDQYFPHPLTFALDCLAPLPEPQPEVPADDGPLRTPRPGIVFADLTLRYDDQPTECPTGVTVEASFAGDAPGKFDVRFHDAFGRASRPCLSAARDDALRERLQRHPLRHRVPAHVRGRHAAGRQRRSAGNAARPFRTFHER